MGLRLEKVVPWGRSFDEYRRMFALSDHDLDRRILDCAGGPAAFNAAMNRRGTPIVSCDPVYQFSAAEIARRIDETYPVIVRGVAEDRDRYVWGDIHSPEHLGEVRLAAMQQFLADFEQGLRERRYIAAELPNLPFNPGQFDLALCSHFLFSYSVPLSWDFHRAAIAQLCEIAREVRLFPLLDNHSGQTSIHLDPAIAYLQDGGYHVEICPVNYQFQQGGDRMLRITHP
jgi:hypothetical protein